MENNEEKMFAHLVHLRMRRGVCGYAAYNLYGCTGQNGMLEIDVEGKADYSALAEGTYRLTFI